MAHKKTDLLTLAQNERGVFVLFDEDNKQIPGIFGIEFKQDLDEMKAGVALVKLDVWVQVKKQNQ